VQVEPPAVRISRSPTIIRGDFRKTPLDRIRFMRAMRRYFPFRLKMKMTPENRDFPRFPSLAMWNSAVAIAIGGDCKNRKRLDRDCYHDVPSRVIAGESCACFAARPMNRFIDRFVWQPVVFVVRFA
jgi:hypothetical protein